MPRTQTTPPDDHPRQPASWQKPALALLALALLALVLLLAACQGRVGSPTASLPVESTGQAGGEAGPTPTEPQALPTRPTLVVAPAGVATDHPAVTPADTPAPDPLRFTFPTPGLEPQSTWRPPLYPIPWAPAAYDHFYFSRPIAADEVDWPIADYRYGGVFFADVVHTGVDIPAPVGTPVLAAGPGRVVWAGYGVYRGGKDPTDPYGLAVTIRHDFGYQGLPLYTIYGHLSQIDVAEGQHVETGQTIGLAGETGNVTGPHLHFELRLGENSYFDTRNPELWIVPPIGWGVLVGRVMDSNGELVTGQQIIVTDPDTGQNWFARSYGAEAVNPDDTYQENLVIGDLPAGNYLLRTAYAGISHRLEIEIRAGLVTYFVFRGYQSFQVTEPPTPGFDPLGTATPAP